MQQAAPVVEASAWENASNSRAFSIAITAGSANVSNRAMCCSEKDVLSQPFRRGESQIGVMRREQAVRAGETEGSRTLVLSGLGG
jgi:hypothetical protein